MDELPRFGGFVARANARRSSVELLRPLPLDLAGIAAIGRIEARQEFEREVCSIVVAQGQCLLEDRLGIRGHDASVRTRRRRTLGYVPPLMRSIELRELLAIEVAVKPIVDLGGGRRFVPFVGGTFTGRDGLRGTLLDGGVDWQQVRSDEILDISAHYALRTEEGEDIEVLSTGIRRATPNVLARLNAGENVDPGEYYFRTHIRLTTAAPRLAWMNGILGLSTGRRERATVFIDVHEVV